MMNLVEVPFKETKLTPEHNICTADQKNQVVVFNSNILLQLKFFLNFLHG